MRMALLQRLAIANVDPALLKRAHAVYQRWKPDPEHPHGSYKVLKTGPAKLIPQITDGMLEAANPDPEALALLRELRLRSYMGVPLTAHGRTLGVIEFFTSESGRQYDDQDLDVAKELARRAAIAIENADLYQALREADRRKDEFLALLAHELRNPLAPIASALNIMKTPEADAATVTEARDMAERQLSHLKRLVDDLLDVSRIMRGKIELRKERIDLATVIARAVETVRPLVDAEQHELIVQLPDCPHGSRPTSSAWPGAFQPAEQCGQVHACSGPNLAQGRLRGWAGRGLGSRYGYRHRAGSRTALV